MRWRRRRPAKHPAYWRFDLSLRRAAVNSKETLDGVRLQPSLLSRTRPKASDRVQQEKYLTSMTRLSSLRDAQRARLRNHHRRVHARIGVRSRAGQRPFSEEISRKRQDFAQGRIKEKRREQRRVAAYRVGKSKFRAIRKRSELRCLLRRVIGCLPITEEAPVCRFGHKRILSPPGRSIS